MNKLKIFFAALLLCAAFPVHAQQADHYRLCTDLSVRLVMFTMIATFADSKDQYDSFMYKKLAESSAEKDAQKLLVKLIEIAWESRGKDARALGLGFYDRCINSEPTV